MRREISLITLLCLSGVMTGCAGPKEEPIKEVKKEEINDQLIIGKKNENGYDTIIQNDTDSAITSIRIKKADEDDTKYSDNLLAKNEKLEKGKEAEWYYSPENTEMNIESKSDKSFNLAFDIQMKLENGSEFTLTTFPFEDFDGTVSICYEDGVGYIKYKSKTDGSEVSTLETEKAAKEKKESSLQTNQEETTSDQQITDIPTSVEQTPVEQAPVYQEPTYQEPVQQAPVYQEPTYQEPIQQAPTEQAPVETPSQGSEGCLGGVDLLP